MNKKILAFLVAALLPLSIQAQPAPKPTPTLSIEKWCTEMKPLWKNLQKLRIITAFSDSYQTIFVGTYFWTNQTYQQKEDFMSTNIKYVKNCTPNKSGTFTVKDEHTGEELARSGVFSYEVYK